MQQFLNILTGKKSNTEINKILPTNKLSANLFLDASVYLCLCRHWEEQQRFREENSKENAQRFEKKNLNIFIFI